jgi:N-acetylglucosaminyl-diphospho-decaprenol L-rhamnosyltransferase
MGGRPSLTAIVVTFRSSATLPAVLDALRREAPADAELIVVENAGDPRTEPLVSARWPGARVITNRHNRGFAGAVNQGLELAGGEQILLLNPDAGLRRGALGILRRALEHLPEAGIVAPRLLDASGRPVLSCYPFLSIATVAWRHFQLYHLFPDAVLGRYRRRALAPSPSAPFPVDWAQGACLLARRDVMIALGGLDERFVLYCEEVDLCVRAAARGWRTYFVPEAEVCHAEGSSSGQVVRLKLASHYLSKVLYFDKHLGSSRTRALLAVLLVDLALRSALRIGGVLRGRPPDARERLATYLWIARALLTKSPGELEQRWKAQARAAAFGSSSA